MRTFRMEEKFVEAASLHEADKHVDALALLDAPSSSYPRATELLYLRAKCFTDLGLADEAESACAELVNAIGRMRRDGDALRDRLDPDEANLFKRFTSGQETRVKALRADVGGRAADTEEAAKLRSQIDTLQKNDFGSPSKSFGVRGLQRSPPKRIDGT